MRTSVNFTISVLMIFCLSLSVCGCGTGPGPRAQGLCCGLWTTLRVQGYEDAVKYRAGDLPPLDRRITGQEYADAVRLARDAGLRLDERRPRIIWSWG